MKRSKHTLSHYRMVTAEMGEVVPIACIPVLPGDTVQQHTNALVRVSPLNTPVMHPVNVRIHHFFCPNRIIDDTFEDFITGGNDGQGEGSSVPTMQTTAVKKSVLTYLGLPPIAGVDILEWPVRAFNKIINEYYRDQDLVTERLEDDITIPKCAWEKDYFTTARPWTQRGPDVSLPLGGTIDVKTDQDELQSVGVYSEGESAWRRLNASQTNLTVSATGSSASERLYVDMGSSSVSVNDFREAFSLQRYQEARARYGARFTEYLRYLGIRPSDARLQRPEYLGGGVSRLNFSEVLQTGPTDTSGGDSDGVGDLFGHGIAGVSGNRYRKFFEEHGYIISCLSVRPKAIYMNGVPREFLKTTKEDFFQKELANLGQQEVYEAELYAENNRDVFGYQDRYEEYRYQPSQVSQDFRDTLNAWHLARELSANPTLNASFVECDPSKRIYQIEDPSVDSLWIMANHHVVARRLVPKRANPRIM